MTLKKNKNYILFCTRERELGELLSARVPAEWIIATHRVTSEIKQKLG